MRHVKYKRSSTTVIRKMCIYTVLEYLPSIKLFMSIVLVSLQVFGHIHYQLEGFLVIIFTIFIEILVFIANGVDPYQTPVTLLGPLNTFLNPRYRIIPLGNSKGHSAQAIQ